MAYTDFANNILHKLQNAAKEMVQARITANSLTGLLPLANVFAGIGGGDIEAKRVCCLAKSGEAQVPWEGNCMAELRIEVRAPAADVAENDFHELAGQIFAFFFQAQETVQTRLSNSSLAFTAQFVIPRQCGWDLEEGADGQSAEWVSWWTFGVMCSGSNIA